MCVLQEHWSGPMGTKVDRAELLRRFYILGGIPRHVFDTVIKYQSAVSLLLGDALKLSAQEAHNVLTGKVSPEDFSGDKTFRPKLASFFPTPPYRTSKIDFVSPYTRALALSHAYETLLNATQRPPGDELFEQAALGLLARSGSLLAKRLPYTKLSSKRKLYETIKFERGTHLPQVAVTQADFVSAARKLKAEAELEPDEAGAPLLVPGVGNQPAVDAVDARDRFYQITQAPKHVITCKAIKELYTDENGAKRKIKLIFVVHRRASSARRKSSRAATRRSARPCSTSSSSWPRCLSPRGSSRSRCPRRVRHRLLRRKAQSFRLDSRLHKVRLGGSLHAAPSRRAQPAASRGA
jgi:hypothetical protein